MNPTPRSHDTATSFVDVTARLSLLMAALGVAWSLLQQGLLVVVPIAQNQPWGCLPVSGRVEIPADWTKD